MNTNEQNNTFNEIEAEAFAEHEALKAEQKAKEEAEQQAKWEVERLERNKVEAVARAKRNAHQSITLRKIAEQVMLQKHKAEVIEEDAKLIIDGVSTSYRLDFVQEQSHQSSWRSTPNGRTRLTVGDYGNRVSFPQRKDGSHNYVEIARLLINYADKENYAAAVKKQQQVNAQVLPELVKEVFPNDTVGYQDVIKASGSAELPVAFSFKINSNMSVENARKLAAALRSCGIKLHYSDK